MSVAKQQALCNNPTAFSAVFDRYTCLFCLAIGLAAVIPHFVFWMSAHEIALFKNAWDEDHYVSAIFRGQPLPSRWCSATLFQIVWLLCNKNLAIAFAAYEFTATFFCALGACIFASRLTTNASNRCALAFLFIFGTDLLMMNNAVIIPQGWSLSDLRNKFEAELRLLIPETKIVYFSVFRTPEPQTSWSLSFIILALLHTFVSDEHDQVSNKRLVFSTLLGFNLILPFAYNFPSVAIICFEILSILVLITKRRFYLATRLGIITAIAVVFYFSVGKIFADSHNFYDLVFHSRTPTLTPAVVLCICTLTIELIYIRSRGAKVKDSFIAISFLSIPIVLVNQQIISGMMVSTKEWERSISYIFLTTGACQSQIAKACWDRISRKSIISKSAPVIFLVLGILILIRGQVSNYKMFFTSNLETLLQKRALKSVIEKTGVGDARIVLEKAYFDEPQLRLRFDNTIRFVHGYSDVISHLIKSMPPGGGEPMGRAYHQNRAFELLARRGETPESFEKGMREAALNRSCWPHLIAYFSFVDCWGPASDDRATRTGEILRQIPSIGKNYREYLQSPSQIWNQPTLYVTDIPPDKVKNVFFENELIASEVSSGNRVTKVYVYWQHPKIKIDE